MERIIGTDLHWQAGLIEHQNMAQHSKSVYSQLFAFSKAMDFNVTASWKIDQGADFYEPL